VTALTVFRLQLGLATLFGGTALLTLVRRDWLEAIFGIDPDQHSGSFEWIVVAVLAFGAVSFACLARRQWRRLVVGP
jgi:hypothetical protein